MIMRFLTHLAKAEITKMGESRLLVPGRGFHPKAESQKLRSGVVDLRIVTLLVAETASMGRKISDRDKVLPFLENVRIARADELVLTEKRLVMFSRAHQRFERIRAFYTPIVIP
jgi:hypothetical protein